MMCKFHPAIFNALTILPQEENERRNELHVTEVNHISMHCHEVLRFSGNDGGIRSYLKERRLEMGAPCL